VKGGNNDQGRPRGKDRCDGQSDKKGDRSCH